MDSGWVDQEDDVWEDEGFQQVYRHGTWFIGVGQEFSMENPHPHDVETVVEQLDAETGDS